MIDPWLEWRIVVYAKTADDMTRVPAVGRAATLKNGSPFVDREFGVLAIHLAGFLRWMTKRGDRPRRVDVLRGLKASGFRRRFTSSGTGGIGRSYWFGPLPDGFGKESDKNAL